jgi:RNA polymerase sigma factor (sigma-70 family)
MEAVTASATRLGVLSLLRLQSDERLAELTSQGSGAAFEILVRRYRGSLLRACRRLLPGDQAEDAVQGALLRAHQALLRNGPPQRFQPWLHRIAINSALKLLADAAGTVPLDTDTVDGVEQPEEAYERRESIRVMVRAIEGLPPRQRQALVLRELEGRTHDEIARELGLSGGAVRQLIHRARNGLRGAASALTPPWLLARVLTPGGGGTGEQIVEVAAAGAGGGLVAKAAVGVLVVGGMAGGVALAPSGERGHREGNESIAIDSARASGLQGGAGSSHRDSGGLAEGSGDGVHAEGDEGPGGGGSGDDDSGGTGEGGSGSTDSGSGSSSGSLTSGSSGSGSGDSGSSGSGSGDGGDLDADSSGSGSSGSGSGSSGSGSGSSGSGSGSSGSGSDTSGSSGSGSDSSTSSTSSGSGSSGSGSGDSGSGTDVVEPDDDS